MMLHEDQPQPNTFRGLYGCRDVSSVVGIRRPTRYSDKKTAYNAGLHPESSTLRLYKQRNKGERGLVSVRATALRGLYHQQIEEVADIKKTGPGKGWPEGQQRGSVHSCT